MSNGLPPTNTWVSAEPCSSPDWTPADPPPPSQWVDASPPLSPQPVKGKING
jgi:hypothetical protein